MSVSKNVVVTGGFGVIGAEICRKFYQSENRVFCVDKSIDRSQIDTFASGFLVCNVANKTDVKNTFTDIFRGFGYIDILINVAGVLPEPSPFVDMDDEKSRKVMDVNYWGAYNCCKAVLPLMREKGSGRIVNISSVAANSADPGNTAYAVSKAAVEKLTKQLAFEAPFNKNGPPLDITVNAVAPGIVDTSMTAGLSEKTLQVYFKRTPIQRKITPFEVASAVYFLATSSSSLNGVILPVDGGYSVS